MELQARHQQCWNISAFDAPTPHYSHPCDSLLRGLLQINPANRITFEELNNHEYFQDAPASPLSSASSNSESKSVQYTITSIPSCEVIYTNDLLPLKNKAYVIVRNGEFSIGDSTTAMEGDCDIYMFEFDDEEAIANSRASFGHDEDLEFFRKKGAASLNNALVRELLCNVSHGRTGFPGRVRAHFGKLDTQFSALKALNVSIFQMCDNKKSMVNEMKGLIAACKRKLQSFIGLEAPLEKVFPTLDIEYTQLTRTVATRLSGYENWIRWLETHIESISESSVPTLALATLHDHKLEWDRDEKKFNKLVSGWEASEKPNNHDILDDLIDMEKKWEARFGQLSDFLVRQFGLLSGSYKASLMISQGGLACVGSVPTSTELVAVLEEVKRVSAMVEKYDSLWECYRASADGKDSGSIEQALREFTANSQQILEESHRTMMLRRLNILANNQ